MKDITGQNEELDLPDDELADDLIDEASAVPVHENVPAVLAALLADVPRGVVGGAGIYLRISQDRNGEGLGVARQLKPCLRLCARIDVAIFDVYVDDDTSATSGKPRKDWNRMLGDVDAGNVGTLVGLNYERLSRTPRELEDVIDLHDQKRIGLATAAGTIDLGTANGRMVARMLGAAARQEVELKAERQKLANRQAAEAGKPHIAGRSRPFGWAAPGDPTIVEDEAEIIRHCARRLLAGEALTSVCRSLNAQGIKTTAGKEWQTKALRFLMVQARLSGRREYNPQVPGKPRQRLGEILAVDAFPQIITPAQSDQLRDKYGHIQNREATNGPGGKPPAKGQPAGTQLGNPDPVARKYLLTGILRCGLCGTGLKGRVHTKGPRYQCARQPGRGGCNKISISAHLVDPHIGELVCTALDNPTLYRQFVAAATKGLADPDKVSAELRAIETKRDDLAEAWANDEMSRREWQTARNRLDARADTLKRQLRGNEHANALLELARMEGDMWHRWEVLSIGGKRALIRACMDHITILPWDPTTSRKIFNPDRIQPEWRV